MGSFIFLCVCVELCCVVLHFILLCYIVQQGVMSVMSVCMCVCLFLFLL